MDDVVILILVGHMHVLAARLRNSRPDTPLEEAARLHGDVGAMTTEAVIIVAGLRRARPGGRGDHRRQGHGQGQLDPHQLTTDASRTGPAGTRRSWRRRDRARDRHARVAGAHPCLDRHRAVVPRPVPDRTAAREGATAPESWAPPTPTARPTPTRCSTTSDPTSSPTGP